MSELTGKKPAEKIQDAAQQAAKAETTSPPRREYRTVLFQVALFSAIAAFGVLTFMVKTTPLLTLDIQIADAIQSINSPIFATLMSLISWVGFPPQSFILSALIVLLIYILGLRWEAISALVAAIVVPIVNTLVKGLIRRPRPTIDLVHVLRILNSYSFPSGHVMYYVGFFGFLWFLAYTLLKRSLMRTLLLIFLGGLIALIGISRIYLGQHWPSDVLGAYLLGSLTLLAILQFYRWGKKRFFVRQPVAPPAPAEVKKASSR
ncbi:MAG TPA: phosphatase PAP2 family protein [Anaerolineales bacterium]|nr:phosphatase PAP2 family protein [Anaerolineales bacterium]HLO32663.1 phosphatase PAP2 family protein [Anaerolineales bacterium]